jgi:hypothetical protein
MFARLTNRFETPLYTNISGLESFAGLDGKGVYHNKIWSPDIDAIYSVVPKQYKDDFYLTLMTINSVLLPHVDNDLVTTINFYIKTTKCRTVFYRAKDNSTYHQLENVITRPKSRLEEDQEVAYVKAVYDLDDVEEIDSFIAEEGEAWLLDVSQIHNVIPVEEFAVRKAIALRTKKYTYNDVYQMLKETNNI